MTGSAILGGILEVLLIDSFVPVAGNRFEFLTVAGGLNGTQFESHALPALPPGLSWRVVYHLTNVALLVSGAITDGDFNNDNLYNCLDVDSLVVDIAGGFHTPSFDLTGDGFVDYADLEWWLAEAGAINLPSGNPYLPADANLDGVVDGSDFNIWNSHKFTMTAAWCSGDLNADGFVDGSDFNLWNSHKFLASDSAVKWVPEPSVWILISAIGGSVVWRRWERCHKAWTKPIRRRMPATLS